MASTPDGAIWFGVNNGLLRYDGISWERHNSENGFVDTAVEQVVVSREGVIYALSRNVVYRRVGKGWKRVIPVKGAPMMIKCLSPAGDGGVWVGSSRGFFHLKGKSLKLFTQPRHVSAVKRILPSHTEIKLLADVGAGNRGVIVGIHEADDGMLYLAYTSGWFVQIDRRQSLDGPIPCTTLQIKQRITPDQLVSMFDMEGGTLWAGFGPNVYIMDISTGKYEIRPLSESRSGEQSNHSLLRLKDGACFIASPAHVSFLSGQDWERYSYPNSDNRNFPFMMADAKQNLWLGKLHGKVYRIDLSNERWATFEGLIYQDEDPSGTQWFLDVKGRVVTHREGEWLLHDQNDGLIDTPVALLCSRNGPVWVVGSHKGKAASVFLTQSGRWQRTIHKELPYHVAPSSLFEDADGSIWFGAYGGSPIDKGGVICAKPDGTGGYQFSHSRKPSKTRYITQLPDGTIVIAAYGLWTINGSELTRIPKGHDSDEKYVALAGSSDGSLWVVNDGEGILRRKEGEWTRYTQKDGLADDTVDALLCRNEDHVWALSANGLSYFDGHGWTPDIYGSFFPGVFQLQGSIHESKDGSLWLNYTTPFWFLRSEPKFRVASNVTFKSIRCRPASHPPDTQIIDSIERVALPGSMTIRWQGNSPWQQTEDNELYYSWRLNKEEWSAYSLSRDITLRSMKPGRYTFEVRARDYDLNVDPTPASIAFIAVAPVWQQAWFILLILLFIALVLFAIWQGFRIHEVKAVADEKYATDLERMKLRFFTNISHELRTPLTVLLGTLKSAMADPRLSLNESVATALRNARKLHALVNEMLDLRKLEQGEWRLEPRYGDIILFIREIAESLRPMAADKNITIRMDDADPELVWFDPGKLNKIMSNLISNAIKYGSQDGQVMVQVLVEKARVNQTGSVVIRVEDDGIGIKADELPRIFDRFYQGTGLSPVKASSSGIGLSFTKELVEMWGGSIEVDSPLNEDRGTRFTVMLPFLDRDSKDEANAESGIEPERRVNSHIQADEDAGGARNEDREKILVVDDDADLRRFICGELADRYTCLEAVDGDHGYSQAVEILPDLILCDVMMPKTGGLELCKRLREEELTHTIPIILLTGQARECSELEGLRAGVDDYVIKPFEMGNLEARIGNLLKSRRNLRERYSREIAAAPKADSEPKVGDPFVTRAREIVEQHLADFEFDANALADQMAVSSSSLWRKLKLAVEKAPSAFIRDLRLKKAYCLLQEEGMMIDEVAEQVGFLDTNYFRRCFKKQFGLTPGQCREGEEPVRDESGAACGPETHDEAPAPTALVVEDDADLRRYVCDELKTRQYEVMEAENGQKGLEQALKTLPDVIVTDLMMPVMNGLQLCEEIKKSDLTNHIPVVMLTARTDSKVEIEGLNIGADVYINKPFEMDVLATHLKNLLEIRKKLATRYRQQLSEPSEKNLPIAIEDPFLQRVIACIEENLQDSSFSVEQLADMMAVTSRTLQRKIPALADLTPKRLIRSMRLKKAFHLLKTTDMPIANVAYDCGFEHPNYFSVQFKQQFGKSPNQVR